jgi:hypothetical protein
VFGQSAKLTNHFASGRRVLPDARKGLGRKDNIGNVTCDIFVTTHGSLSNIQCAGISSFFCFDSLRQ